jgi:uncharacterized membrane protein
MVAHIGDLKVGLPITILCLLFFVAIILMAALYGKRRQAYDNKLFYALAGSAIATVLLLSTTLYLTYTPVGLNKIEGIQGRYFIPLLPLFILLIIRISPKIQLSPRVALAGLQLVTLFLLSGTSVVYYLTNY